MGRRAEGEGESGEVAIENFSCLVRKKDHVQLYFFIIVNHPSYFSIYCFVS